LRLLDHINGFNKAFGPSVAGIAPEIEAMQSESAAHRVKGEAIAKLGLGVLVKDSDRAFSSLPSAPVVE